MSSLVKLFCQRRIKLTGAIAVLGAGLTAGPVQALTITLPFSGVNSYAQCVIKQINTKTGALQVDAIESQCRTIFPQPSRRSLFAPRNVSRCYARYEDRAAHRAAAEAIYGACQDYFRRG